MVYRVNLKDSPEIRQAQRFQALESEAPNGRSSITRGGMRIQSEEGLLVKGVPGGGAAMKVEGRQSVSGELDGNGTFTWTGPWNLDGDGGITGNADITGILSLLSDLIVKAGGEIRVEGPQPITLRQVGGRAQIDFGSTGSAWSGGDGVTIFSPTGGDVTAYSGGVDINAGLGGTVNVTGTVRMPDATTSTSTTGMRPLYVDANGRIYKGAAL